ncbi:Outer membrane protein assembly factor BamC [Halioglobus japonicus]|nr:Outer membrane protein assembly factor BamC [Halioglobus japonicus]
MLIRVVQSVLVGSLVLSSTGCGYIFGDEGIFRDRSQDYKAAPELPPITVPPGMESVPLREIYVIPPVEDKFLAQGKFEAPKPAPLSSGAGSDVVRIQKLGDASWALIGVAPGQVWPQVRNFISASGMQVTRADAQSGIMETNWVTVEGENLTSRFQFRIDQGVQRGTSELHVLQMRQTGGDATWPDKSDDPSQAKEMLRAVSQYLADSADSAPVSMIAEQGISAGGRIAMLEGPDGSSYLQLDLPFDRAWASLGRALGEASFEITDKDRSSGVYYVLFTGEAEAQEEGWWGSLWNSDDDRPMVGEAFVINVQTISDRAVTIQLRPQDASFPFDNRDGQQLLSVIKGNID